MGALRQNITDRALRYRANQAIPEHRHVCAFCGATGRLDVGHLNGNESDDSPANLTWTCRPCNVEAGNVLRNAGMGRKTHQFNPTKGGGAANVGEWLQAVGAITPHVNRGDRGLASQMSVSEAVAMIRATPHHKRSEYAAKLRKKNPGYFSPGGAGYVAPGKKYKGSSSWGSRDSVRDVQAERKAASKQADIDARLMRAEVKRQAKLLGAKKAATPKKSRLLDADLAKGIFGLGNPSYEASLVRHAETSRSAEELQRLYNHARKHRDTELGAAVLKRAEQLRLRVQGNPSKFDRCVRDVQAKGGAANAYAVCTAAGTRKKKNPSVAPRFDIDDLQDGNWQTVASVRAWSNKEAVRLYRLQHPEWTKGRKLRARELTRSNPADVASERFEEFHGFAPTETVTVTKKVHHHKHLAAAGKLKALSVKPIDRALPVRTLKGFKGSLLCFNEKKNQLFVEGGDQCLGAAELQHFGIDSPHELETLGRVTDINYHTTKTHLGDEGGTANYVHAFRTTNEKGKHVVVSISRYPDLIYRVLDEQLEFSGGSYTIRAEGIDV